MAQGVQWLTDTESDRPRIHVLPLGDLREHETVPQCWCHPVQDDEYPALWVHSSMDRREHTRERGAVQ